MPQRTSSMAARLVPPAILVGLSAALFAYLLARFPYNGLYGQDAYAYYYQAEALWREITGQAQPPLAQFTANGLYWPVGYHLHLLPGFLMGWPEAGRTITLALSALTPAVLYLLVGEIWYTATVRQRIAAGLGAGAVLVLTGTYTRTGLSLMSDVPAVFWGTLAIYCCLRAWPPVAQPHIERSRDLWALAAGMSLGVAVLVRYSSTLLLPAVIVYLLARSYTQRTQGLSQHDGEHRRERWPTGLLWAALGLAIALLPQLAYSLTHEPGPALRSWSLDNVFSSTVSGPDGSATYTLPMIAFYLFSTLVNAGGGFLSPLCLPALGFGVWILVHQRNVAILFLIFVWWLIPVLAYSGTPYQTHRFALIFMPVLALFVGIGASTALSWLQEVRSRTQQPDFRRAIMGLAATLTLVAVGVGLAQGWRSVEQWVETHSAFNYQDQQVVALAREAVAASGREGTPRVVCFGFSAPLYHYTRWPILDFFAHDEADIQDFLAVPGPHVLVLPEESMSTQWAGTPPSARWQWVQSTYKLTRQGRSGAFTVYVIGDR